MTAGRQRLHALGLPAMGRATATLCALLPAAVAATPYDGTYRQHARADCARVGEEGGALQIGGGVFTGVGATCQMTRPVDVLDMDATIYTMECTGEGEGWTERAIVMDTAEGDGIIMVWNGYAFRYDRCPAPDAAPDAASEDAADRAGGGPDPAEPGAGDPDAAGDAAGGDQPGPMQGDLPDSAAPVIDRTP